MISLCETQKLMHSRFVEKIPESSLRYCYVDRIEAINAEGGIRDRPGKRNVKTNLAGLSKRRISVSARLRQLAGKGCCAIAATRACRSDSFFRPDTLFPSIDACPASKLGCSAASQFIYRNGYRWKNASATVCGPGRSWRIHCSIMPTRFIHRVFSDESRYIHNSSHPFSISFMMRGSIADHNCLTWRVSLCARLCYR
jgi:hypothetical protein